MRKRVNRTIELRITQLIERPATIFRQGYLIISVLPVNNKITNDH